MRVVCESMGRGVVLTLAVAGCAVDSGREDDPVGGGVPAGGQGTPGTTGGEDGGATGDGDGTGVSDGTSGQASMGDPDGPKFDLGSLPDVPSSGESCQSGPNEDADGDGFTVEDGDCNDCDANVNPGAVEVVNLEPDDQGQIPPPADEDCDGTFDNVEPACDDGIALDDSDPMNAARAIGLCRTTTADAPGWGVIDARYVRANGNPLPAANMFQAQHGVFDNFGANVWPRSGKRMLGLSSGRARIPGQPDACGSLSCPGIGGGSAPQGFPQDVPGCAGDKDINDDVALELTLKAPTNATGYRFNFDFYSFEYPEWVCTSYNDQFIALVDPPPAGSIDGNISFDSQLNPVSINIAFFEVCEGCPLGTAELVGTGFDTWDDAGATSWLETTAPIGPGEVFKIRFTIWDTGDTAWDSTVLIDNFEWIADGGTVDVGTTPAG